MSDTNPLPAQTLLALADDAVVGTCQKCRRRVKMSSVTHDGGHKTCAGPVKFGSAGKAYRAARAASPVCAEVVRLEEAELIIQHLISDEDSGCHCQTQWGAGDCGLCKAWKFINARRLAGEGGA